jgi:hypothetical protein
MQRQACPCLQFQALGRVLAWAALQRFGTFGTVWDRSVPEQIDCGATDLGSFWDFGTAPKKTLFLLLLVLMY